MHLLKVLEVAICELLAISIKIVPFATGPSIIQIDRVQTTNLPSDGLVSVQLDNARANNLNGDEAFLPIRNGEPTDKAVAILVEIDPGTLEGDQTITYSTSITCILQ